MDNKELAEKYELKADDFWKHNQSGKWIISHKAVMKIADVEGVVFHKPDIIRDGMTSIVLYGEATYKEKAMPENCRMPYFWAMAEKRLKDRLTLTLIDVYGDFYSEIEADEFAAQHPEMKPAKQYGPPSDKQKYRANKLINERVDDDDKKAMWFAEIEKPTNTWEMSQLIDKLQAL